MQLAVYLMSMGGRLGVPAYMYTTGKIFVPLEKIEKKTRGRS